MQVVTVLPSVLAYCNMHSTEKANFTPEKGSSVETFLYDIVEEYCSYTLITLHMTACIHLSSSDISNKDLILI